MNRDILKRFANQFTEKRFDECVGETISDIVGNITGVPMDPGYSYAAALRCAGTKPTTAGADGYSGCLGALVYGAIPTDKQPFDASTTSELYESNVSNYPLSDRALALGYVQSGVKSLYTWDDICNYLMANKAGVQMTMLWHQNMNAPSMGGVLPMPVGNVFTYHSVAVYEDCTQGLRIKPWLGPEFGDGGYVYITKEVFAQAFISATAFDLNAWRWLSLASAGVWRPYLLNDTLPQLQGKNPFLPAIADDTINPMTLLGKFGNFIKSYEGASPANNNPYNDKYYYGGYLPKYGAVKRSPGGFAMFPTLAIGEMYGQTIIRQILFHHPDVDFYGFFAIYAPQKDNNDPVKYAQAGAAWMGVEPTANLKQTLNV